MFRAFKLTCSQCLRKTKTSGQAPSTFFHFPAFILRINAVSFKWERSRPDFIVLLYIWLPTKGAPLHPVCTATRKTNTTYQTKYCSAVRLLTENKRPLQSQITKGGCEITLSKEVKKHKIPNQNKTQDVKEMQLCAAFSVLCFSFFFFFKEILKNKICPKIPVCQILLLRACNGEKTSPKQTTQRAITVVQILITANHQITWLNTQQLCHHPYSVFVFCFFFF